MKGPYSKKNDSCICSYRNANAQQPYGPSPDVVDLRNMRIKKITEIEVSLIENVSPSSLGQAAEHPINMGPKRLPARSAAPLAEQSCEEMIQNLKRNVGERAGRSVL
jgi:hypothetical protein